MKNELYIEKVEIWYLGYFQTMKICCNKSNYSTFQYSNIHDPTFQPQ